MSSKILKITHTPSMGKQLVYILFYSMSFWTFSKNYFILFEKMGLYYIF